jgi:hypothetical protein
METATITGVLPNGLSLVLSRSLTFPRRGVSFTSGPSSAPSVTIAAAVGLLTRNVVFRGTNVNAATPNYGAHIVVGNIVRPSAQFIGSVDISYAQLHNCGKMGMEHAALAFTYTSTMPAASAPVNTVNGSSFSYSFNYAVVGTMARNLVLRDNVFHRTYRTSVDLDELVRVCFRERSRGRGRGRVFSVCSFVCCFS